MLLSVVIVARNEEKNIARCIESVLRETANISDTEILLVDSASTDKTVEIAKRYPINIIQLKPDWPLSPSAGRFSGVNNTTGKYILIIDGDMELLEGWIKEGLDFLERHSKVAAVVGKQYDCYAKKDECKLGRASQNKTGLQKIDYVFESSIFRRSHLMQAGNFQPYLRAEEEAEISYRLKKAGWDLFFMPYKSIYHYKSFVGFKETLRRLTTGLYPGMGDMLSWCLRKGYYSILWERFKVFFLFCGMIVCSIVGALILLFLNHRFLAFTVFLSPIYFFVFQCIKKRGIKQGLISCLNIVIISLSLLQGLFRKIPEISEYPTDVVWIKRCDRLGN